MVAGESTVPFSGNGLAGSYVIHVPASSVAGTPIPLVFDLHGYSEPVAVHVILSGLASFGETAGFVTVAPGIDRPVPLWDATVGGADVGFLQALLGHLESTVCIDTNRVYFAGLSNGAFMTSAVACSLGARVAAAAPVAGIQAPEGCRPGRPVPVVTFHGTDDGFVPYTGGLGDRVSALPSPDGTGTIGPVAPSDASSVDQPTVADRTAAWAQRNGCAPEPVEEPVADDVTLVRFDCPPGAEVLLYRVEGGGHSWPGSEFSAQIESIVGPTTFSISANEILWDFFLDHPLRM